MNLAAELAHSNLSPAVRAAILAQAEWVQAHTDLAVKTVAQAALIQAKSLLIEKLEFELAYLRRMQFGAKTEAMSAEQRSLFDEEFEVSAAALEAQLAAARPDGDSTPVRQPRMRAGRQALPAHLPRTLVVHEPESCTCGACGNDLLKVSEDVSEQLHVQPAVFSVIRHIRPQYACRRCQTMTAAPVAPSIIDGGLPSNATVAWVMVSKYVDHLPLYRIRQIAERSGVNLAESTLGNWVGTTGWWLQMLADRLVERLRQEPTLHADETPIKQLDPGNGKTKTAYLWAYRSTPLSNCAPMIVFDYQISRAGQHARDFLQDWQGQLMVDDYGGYKALFKAGVTELACWAHARRKFVDLHKANQSPVALEAMRRIAELYAIEAQAKEETVAERHALRQQVAKPKLTELKAWLTETLPKVAPNGAIAKAILYSQRAAAIQTLLGTAKLNGLDPQAWLTDTLEKLPTWPNSRIDELLPLLALAEK
ncbi:Transposase and inactivated derivatives [Iodobacter fluviatilis]|uniref:Transposase and inactivated derivatives n=2 Tax=Iodobacter fluviatilis TaxID=537 RepID=A0A377Q6G3_9NEIS|nr:IS66 family transposase [Iodobacter fluviatilis]STQ90199.1 Transposase and inactivated derivatives [Iodobacter fluviatilis]